jgi:hypothetical protein
LTASPFVSATGERAPRLWVPGIGHATSFANDNTFRESEDMNLESKDAMEIHPKHEIFHPMT